MIDEGETDWKVIVIDAEDKWAPFLNDIDDVETQLPGQLDAIREWYRTYKIPDGKPPNTFALGERFMNKEYAVQIIMDCHQAWEDLISGEKERQIVKSGSDAHVVNLVRNLSRNSLFTLGADLDEHLECRNETVNDMQDEEGVLMF
jgi:inorganic pyrophosphatase